MKLASAAAQRLYAGAAPDEKRESAMRRVEELEAAIPPKREYKQSDPQQLEAAVLREVGELLAVHPRILLAVRQNGGATQYQGPAGRAVPVWFYRIIRQPHNTKVRVPDYWGWLTDMRPFAIECKRRDWSKPSGKREASQAAFLGMIRGLGGIGIFATSAEQVAAALG